METEFDPLKLVIDVRNKYAIKEPILSHEHALTHVKL